MPMTGTPMLGEYREFLASAARTASGEGTAFDTADWDIITAQVRATAVAGVTPVLIVRIQTTYDDAVTWTDIAVTNVDITAVDRKLISTVPPGPTTLSASSTATDGTLTVGTVPKPLALGTQCRFQWTITGTTPSFTFAITGVVRRLAA